VPPQVNIVNHSPTLKKQTNKQTKKKKNKSLLIKEKQKEWGGERASTL